MAEGAARLNQLPTSEERAPMRIAVAALILIVTASSLAWARTCYTNCYRDFQGNQHCTTTCY